MPDPQERGGCGNCGFGYGEHSDSEGCPPGRTTYKPQERGGATGELEVVGRPTIHSRWCSGCPALCTTIDIHPVMRDLQAELASVRAQLAERDARITELEAIVARETNETAAMFQMGEERRRLLAQVEAMRGVVERLDPSLLFRSRGIGSDWTPGCFVCGGSDELRANTSGFVRTRAEGEQIVAEFCGRGARLDYREREPNWIQVKIGACKSHTEQLGRLSVATVEAGGQINRRLILATLDQTQPPQQETAPET